MTNLKSLLQLPIKADQRGPKDCCEMKGECVHVHTCMCLGEREREREREREVLSARKLLKGTVSGNTNKSLQEKKCSFNMKDRRY